MQEPLFYFQISMSCHICTVEFIRYLTHLPSGLLGNVTKDPAGGRTGTPYGGVWDIGRKKIFREKTGKGHTGQFFFWHFRGPYLILVFLLSRRFLVQIVLVPLHTTCQQVAMDIQHRELATLLVKRAEINLEMEDFSSALKDLQTAIEKDPTYVKVEYNTNDTYIWENTNTPTRAILWGRELAFWQRIAQERSMMLKRYYSRKKVK